MHLCDNQNIVKVLNRGFAKSSIQFRDEYIAFHKLCERKSITCRAAYVESKRNLAADLATRHQPWLALQCLAWIGHPITDLRTDFRNLLLIASQGMYFSKPPAHHVDLYLVFWSARPLPQITPKHSCQLSHGTLPKYVAILPSLQVTTIG